MKQPKNDDRPEVLSPYITKGQHIVPAYIIKKWLQDVVITGKTKKCPFDIKFRKNKNEYKKAPSLPQSEGSKFFCVYHRWSQSFEVNANKFVEKPFFKLIDELEKDERDIIKFDFIKDKETLTIIKYYELIKRRMYYKLNNSNKIFKNFVGVKSSNYTKKQQEALELKHVAYYVDGEMRGSEFAQYKVHMDCDKMCAEDCIRTLKEHQDWFYIKINDKTSRFFLPDNWNNWQIVSISPYSIFISQAFINYLGSKDYLQFLDIKNPPFPIRKIVKLSTIINNLAMQVYDKWIIF